MKLLDQKPGNDRLAIIACLVLATACFIATIYHFKIVFSLKQHGLKAEAVVIDIETGSRNSKWAIYQFVTQTGQEVIARDTFQQYIKEIKKEMPVIVLYDPMDPATVTADLGNWIWQGAIIFFSAFIFLIVLGILIAKHNVRTGRK